MKLIALLLTLVIGSWLAAPLEAKSRNRSRATTSHAPKARKVPKYKAPKFKAPKRNVKPRRARPQARKPSVKRVKRAAAVK